jgi:hypothetical protein
VEEFNDHGPATAVSPTSKSASAAISSQIKSEDVDKVATDDLVDEDDGPDDEASGDDYKDEEQHDSVVVRRGRGTKRVSSVTTASYSPNRCIFFLFQITSSDEEGDDDPPSPRAPSRRAQLKRKRGKETHSVQRKRLRKPSSEVETDDDHDLDERQKKGGNKKSKTKHDSILDPTRKYCLGKLREVLLPIFVQFANFPQASDGQRPEDATMSELDEEHKKKAEENGAVYVQDLEQCLFEIYGELDKHGHKTAVGKYKYVPPPTCMVLYLISLYLFLGTGSACFPLICHNLTAIIYDVASELIPSRLFSFPRCRVWTLQMSRRSSRSRLLIASR